MIVLSTQFFVGLCFHFVICFVFTSDTRTLHYDLLLFVNLVVLYYFKLAHLHCTATSSSILFLPKMVAVKYSVVYVQSLIFAPTPLQLFTVP